MSRKWSISCARENGVENKYLGCAFCLAESHYFGTIWFLAESVAESKPFCCTFGNCFRCTEMAAENNSFGASRNNKFRPSFRQYRKQRRNYCFQLALELLFSTAISAHQKWWLKLIVSACTEMVVFSCHFGASETIAESAAERFTFCYTSSQESNSAEIVAFSKAESTS